MRVAVLGIGTALPRHTIAQPAAAELAKAFCCQTVEQARVLPALFRRSLVDQRGSVLLDRLDPSALSQSFFPDAVSHTDRGPTTQQRMQRYVREAAPLTLAAARQALARSGLSPERITQLITVSCTGFIAPGVDVTLIKQLALPPTVGRTHVGFMGCAGALNGLRLAAALGQTSADARVLLCAVELCSLHFQYGWDPDRLVANALFADGAAALITSPAASAMPPEAWQVAGTGSYLFPESEDAMAWRIGDHGFEMTLSTRVPALIARHLRSWLETWLGWHGLALADIGSWAIHPGGPRILSAVEACLGLSESATAVSREILSSCGNMSSPTILFILDRLRRRHAPRPCVALGFAPGLVAEAALFV